MRSTLLLPLLVALVAAPAGAAGYRPHNPDASLRLEVQGGDDGSVTSLTGTPPPVAGGLPHVYFVDLAWSASAAHLLLRNPSFGDAQVRSTVARSGPSFGPSSGTTLTTEAFAIASGAVLHEMYDLHPSPKGNFGRNYALIASDRPLLVSARAFASKYAHELVPRELDCPGAGAILDPEGPDAFLCELARR
jgi:hypothetical protein